MAKSSIDEDSQSLLRDEQVLRVDYRSDRELRFWRLLSSWGCRNNTTNIGILSLIGLCSTTILLLIWLVVIARTLQSHMASNSMPLDPAISAADGRVSTIHITDCGGTPERARAAGCKFDIMSFGWTAPECWDDEVYNGVVSGANFTWMALDGTPVSTQEVESGDYSQLWSIWSHRLVQCTYIWQKLSRAVLIQRPLDEWSASYAYASHCGYDLFNNDRFPQQSMSTLMTLWYPKCGLDNRELLEMLVDPLFDKQNPGLVKVDGLSHE